MAKMFYTLDEAKATLAKTEEEIKQLARDGRLREFRDGPRLMFKADQVEQLKNDMSAGGGSEPEGIGSSDSGMAIGLTDSKSGSGMGSGIGSGPGVSGSGLTLVEGGGSGQMSMKDDTALATDLGLSGSVGGMPSPGAKAGASSGTGLSGSTSGRAGIDVFQNDEVERVDPSAQTAISAGINEQINLEGGVGSGSGLLDLTREKDDTSLGAELLDEIAPSASVAGQRRAAGDSQAGMTAGTGFAEPRASGSSRMSPGSGIIYREKPDPWAPAMAGAALGASGVVMFSLFGLICGILNYQPPMLAQAVEYSFTGLAAIGVGTVLLMFVIGAIIGRVTSK